MTKEEARQRLKKLGYNVIDDSSVVTVVVGRDTPFKTALNDVKKKLKELGYDASFSVRQLKDGDVLPETDETDDPELSDAADMMDEEFSDIASGDEEDDAAASADQSVTSASDDGPKDSDTSKEDKEEASGSTEDDEPEFFDDEDMDMILTEDAVQFSLDDFGLSF